MSEPFVGEIRMFAGNFAPRGWSFCDGQLIDTSQNAALYSLLGTVYGGDGKTTFGLPDLRGRIPIHAGTGPSLSPRKLGEKGGIESVTLMLNNLPAHSHPVAASAANADSTSVTGNVVAKVGGGKLYRATGTQQDMNSFAISSTGKNFPHENIMPFVCLNYIVSLFGIYPPRN